MTLILAGGNQEYVALMSDRRLSGDGEIYDDEANKAIILATPDCRLTFAFTGVAKWGAFDTLKWLLAVLANEVNSTKYEDIYNLLAKITSEATIAFKELPKDAMLTIVAIGYVYKFSSTPQLICWEITNFNNVDEFELFTHSPKSSKQSIFQVFGNTIPVSDEQRTQLETLIEASIPAVGFQLKCHHIIRNIVKKFPSGSIGEQCTACLIYVDVDKEMLSTYFSKYVDSQLYSVSASLLGSTLHSMEFSGKAHTSPTTVPVPENGKNAPCPCGSGLKYKNCHRKISYPFLDMYFSASPGGYANWNHGSEERFPSGKEFKISSRGATFR